MIGYGRWGLRHPATQLKTALSWMTGAHAWHPRQARKPETFPGPSNVAPSHQHMYDNQGSKPRPPLKNPSLPFAGFRLQVSVYSPQTSGVPWSFTWQGSVPHAVGRVLLIRLRGPVSGSHIPQPQPPTITITRRPCNLKAPSPQ